jgi:hypothetical protein
MTVAVLSGLAMFAGDVLQALYVVLLGRGRSTLAGCFDGLNDLTTVISIGGGADVVFRHALGWLTALTLTLIFAGSVAGAVVGGRLSARFTHKPAVTESRIH